MGEIRVLNESGDESIAWDPADSEQVAKAKAEFDRLKGDGYRFYAVEETKGREVARFDKKLGRLIAAPGGKTSADKERGARPRAMAGGPTARRAPRTW
jgi:hypothetical protein